MANKNTETINWEENELIQFYRHLSEDEQKHFVKMMDKLSGVENEEEFLRCLNDEMK